ncbi:MAG: hypothetical protein A2X25_12045 [Chloroflexi bacterium GWB2_49_20]|nr:MAG: hypothetical protein A2X25_12045 [Chloroflexi bacterium GWB2_49_20]OGN77733.1 MAG: hypothetical protein A2X26_10315 [Chloroflexi bacterium GWC2_49_37]OGN86508.1 MAG: hypothetical protein A2X27_06470 [Chloroflexi bacterium GWD2_49_16]HBG74760.1 hypothetical protein [Anaerolineae bacterium]
MKIELLYFDGCPSWQTGLEKLKTALQMEQLEDFVEVIKVKNDTDAARLKFLGSPSFLADGQDLWPEERDTYSLSCRVYITPEGLRGWPSVEMLREKLKAARGDFR